MPANICRKEIGRAKILKKMKENPKKVFLHSNYDAIKRVFRIELSVEESV